MSDKHSGLQPSDADNDKVIDINCLAVDCRGPMERPVSRIVRLPSPNHRQSSLLRAASSETIADQTVPSTTANESTEIPVSIQPTSIQTEQQSQAEQPAPSTQAAQSSSSKKDWRKLIIKVRRQLGSKLGAYEDKPAPELWIYFCRLKALRKLHPNNKQVNKRWKEVRDFIFSLHWVDAERIAHTYLMKNMPRYSLLEEGDLKQGVAKCLLECIDTYDISVGTDFMQYANAKKSRLKGAVIDALRKLQNCTREIAKHRRELRPLFAKLTQVLRKNPSTEDFLEYYGKMSPDGEVNYEKILTSLSYWSNVYNQPRKGGYDSADASENSEEFSMETEDKRAIGACGMERGDSIKKLLAVIKDNKTNFTIWAYYFAEMTSDQIAEHLSCSPSVVSTKRKEGIEILKANFMLSEFKAIIGKD